MLEGYEEVCPDCKGTSPGDYHYWCNRCGSKGTALTEQGEKLKKFVECRIISDLEQSRFRAEEEQRRYIRALPWWSRLRMGLDRVWNGG